MTVDHLAELRSLAAIMADDDVPDTLPELLAAMFPPRPAWMRDALCRERPRTDFFPPSRADEGGARSTCRDCLVRAECLDYALDHGERGIWGGTNDEERRAMRPPLPVAVRCSTCATWFESPRGHAAYCSATCRTKAAKARNRRSA